MKIKKLNEWKCGIDISDTELGWDYVPVMDFGNRSIVFAYKTNDNDRDCVAYVESDRGVIHTDISGQVIITGPCFSSRVERGIRYKDCTTILTEEEFEALKEDDIDKDMLEQIQNHLLSKSNQELIEKVKKEELEAIMTACGISKDEAQEVVDDYPLGNGYFDRGICCSFSDTKELVINLVFNFGCEDWLVNFLKDYADDEQIMEYLDNSEDIDADELERMGYDFNIIDVTQLNDSYKELNSGTIIEYYM